ncbi:MAG: hypothetical protein KDC49_20010, partial [Saprospiraceae bacterium]|nr:hypothetical protein [Saprospiraceae bacterium]
MSFNFTQETTSKCLSKAKVIFLPLIMLLLALDVSAQCPLFSNELHYDNTGADANERIEIGGEAGTSMNGWSVVFYNGFDGTSIATVNLTGNLPAAQCTISGVPISFRVIDVLSETTFSFQNGSPDGWALVNGTTVVEFYSYEGTFTATNGPANGLQSTDIGVFEDGNGATTGSIQRTSTSTWAVNASTNTFGACNTSQYGPPCGSNPVVTLSLNKTEGSEANTTVVTATANATAPVSGAQTVTLAITGTNITGGDYTLSSTTITIPNGATSGSVTFTVVNDAVAENTETAVFTISNPTSGITLGATVSRNFTIFDNDAPLATRCLVFSNEIHYDNSGTDANERIELAGDAGTSLTGWSVYLYESGGTVYGTANLSGSIPNTGTCSVSGRTIGLTVLDIPALTGQSIQGGPADGWALVYNGTVVEFFSYEGTILATAGPALGMTSVDIGASEDGTGTSDGSIQRTGPNTWVTSASTNTFGSCNSTQYVTPCSTTPSVNLTLSVYEGTEAAGTVVQVIATTNSAVVGNQTVNLAITGTNVTGTDYTISNLVITIPNGTNTGTVTFTVLNDALFENAETVNFVISNPSMGVELGFLTSQNFIIYDNDISPFVKCEIYSNEIHYDNTGTDANEFIELIGEVGASLDDWQVFLYDNTGNPYGNPINLSGTIPNTNSCMVGDRLLAPYVLDVLALSGSSIMGGPSDGWALVHSSNVVEFWSYEGTINAVSGPAIGLTSTNIGASEDGTGQTTGSIQRTDTLTWVTSTTTNTFGACNTTQYSKPCLQYTLTCPMDTIVSNCLTQSAVDAAFATWLARYSATGGTNGVLSNNNTGAPDSCGGSTTVTFYYVFDELPGGDSCMATFTVSPPPSITLTCPMNTTAAACQTQSAVDAAFATWLATATASGGCNGVLTNNNVGAPPACGGSTTVTFSYSSSCAAMPTTCQATFTVSPPPPVILICPMNTTTAACQTQTAVDAAFASWLASASGMGGCNGVLTNNNTGAPSACGGSTTVTFTYSSTCAPFTTTCQATFTVSPPPTVILTCPTNTTTAACQTQTAVDAAFASWLASASGMGGCNGVLTNNNTGAPSACGGSTTVTFTYSSTCAPFTTTCQATFTVSPPPTVILTCPTNTTTAACQTQTAVDAAFASWLASASGMGGCNGVLT